MHVHVLCTILINSPIVRTVASRNFPLYFTWCVLPIVMPSVLRKCFSSSLDTIFASPLYQIESFCWEILNVVKHTKTYYMSCRVAINLLFWSWSSLRASLMVAIVLKSRIEQEFAVDVIYWQMIFSVENVRVVSWYFSSLYTLNPSITVCQDTVLWMGRWP